MAAVFVIRLPQIRQLGEATEVIHGAQHDAAAVDVDGASLLKEAEVLVDAFACDTDHAGQFVLAQVELHLAPLHGWRGEVEQLPDQTAMDVQEGELAHKLIGRSQASPHHGQNSYGRCRA